MADGSNLVLGADNNEQSQTNLTAGLGTDDSGNYGLHVQALDGNAVGGVSSLGFGVEGISGSASGVAGKSTSDDGVYGISTSGTGAHGTSTSGSGVRGTSFQGSGVEGFSYGPGAGVIGIAPYQSAPGVVGFSQNAFGVRGQSGAATLLPPVGGGAQFQKCAVQGSSDEGTGVRGDSAHKVGVRGRSFSGDGVFGSCADESNALKTKGNGVHGQAPRPSPNATTGPFAGRFDGDVTISGRLFVGNRLIAYAKIAHSSLVLASGVVNLDAKGEAIVKLASGLGAAHRDFRYQITAVGGPAPNLHVAEEIRGDRFKIAGGTSKLRVCWQVSGEPKDLREPAKRPAKKTFDPKLAQRFSREAKEMLRKAEEAKKTDASAGSTHH